MPPALLAFDLDGTLLTTDKRLTSANREALLDMVRCGSRIALASGRMRAAMQPYADMLGTDIAMLTMNGAAVYTSAFGTAEPIYRAELPAPYAQHLVDYSRDGAFILNYYLNGKLYARHAPHTRAWAELYVKQTGSVYHFRDTLDEFAGSTPSKVIFVGTREEIDRQEEHFRALWGEEVYICRTWTHYLEFLHPAANKGSAIVALARALAIDPAHVAAFGDSENDIPMLREVGNGIAVANADRAVRDAARRVSVWSNDQDAIAREWEALKVA